MISTHDNDNVEMVTLPNSKLNFPKTFHIPKLVGFSPKILLLKTALLISNDM